MAMDYVRCARQRAEKEFLVQELRSRSLGLLELGGTQSGSA